MRLLDKGNLQLDMTKLGLRKTLFLHQDGIHQPMAWVGYWSNGFCKTTTLYSALSELNQTTTNILRLKIRWSLTYTGSTKCRCMRVSGLTLHSTKVVPTTRS